MAVKARQESSSDRIFAAMELISVTLPPGNRRFYMQERESFVVFSKRIEQLNSNRGTDRCPLDERSVEPESLCFCHQEQESLCLLSVSTSLSLLINDALTCFPS